MRMIEQLAKVLAKILFNKENGDYNSALNKINAAFNSIVGIDHNMLTQLSADDIISLLKISKDNTTAGIKCIAIAKLFKEKADIEKLNGNEKPELVYNYQKALRLYIEGILNIKNTDIDIGNFYPDVKEIVDVLDGDITPEIRIGLFKFYVLLGDYDKAENELFRLKNLDYPNIEEEGIKFFRKLEELSENDLIKGNFSRAEVTQGFSDFITKAT
jgi:hypothetical protein